MKGLLIFKISFSLALPAAHMLIAQRIFEMGSLETPG